MAAYEATLQKWSDEQESYAERAKAAARAVSLEIRLRNGGGAIAINADTRRAEQQFAAAAADGHLRSSPRTQQRAVEGLWIMRTDVQKIPRQQMACGLWAIFAVLGMSAAELGLQRDPLVMLPPAMIGMNMLAGMFARMRERDPSSPAAALFLQPCRSLTAGWSVLRERDGLFVLTAWLVRGLVSLAHFVAFNAGTRVLHLGPWREIVTDADVADVEMYAADVSLKYGVYLSETCIVRQLWMNPHASGCRALSYNVPEELEHIGESRSRRRMKKRKQREAAQRYEISE